MLTTTSVYMNHNHQFNIIACEQQHNNSNNPYNQCYKTELGLSCEDNLITLIHTNSYTLTRPEVPSPWPIVSLVCSCTSCKQSCRSPWLRCPFLATETPTHKISYTARSNLNHLTRPRKRSHPWLGWEFEMNAMQCKYNRKTVNNHEVLTSGGP